MSAPVPKFLSFKPKAKPESSARNDAPSSATADRKHSHSRQDRREPREDDRSRVDDAARGKHRNESQVPSTSNDHAARTSDIFTVDTKGDVKNLTYGSLHKYSIPQYRRDGFGCVVGLSRDQRIDRQASSTTEIYLGNHTRQHEDRTLERPLLKKQRAAREPLYQQHTDTKSQASLDLDAHYIALSRPRKRRRVDDTGSGDSDDSDDPVDHLGNEITPDDSVFARHKQAELARLVKAKPGEVASWQRFIEHQSQLVAPGVPDGQLTGTKRRTVAELRMSIYEDAFRAVAPADRPILLEAFLSEGDHIWETATQLRKREEYLLQSPDAGFLWTGVVDMLLSPGRDSSYEEIKTSLISFLDRLSVAITASKDKNALEIAQIHVILRVTTFTYDAGYAELAIALWQALLQLHVTSDQSIPFASRLSDLESAWDNEDPRFGEDAQATTEATDGSSTATWIPNLPALSEELAEVTANGTFADFAKRELQLSALELPGRVSDETTEDGAEDALHVVFFEDMRGILHTTKAGLDSVLLLDAFLEFVGLPALPITAMKRVGPWRLDSAAVSNSSSSSSNDSLGPVIRPNLLTALDAFEQNSCPVEVHERPVILRFLDNGLAQLVALPQLSEHLTVYYLAFQAAYHPATATKTARRLLRQNPSNMQLYNAAAILETRAQRWDKAENIWSMAVKMLSLQAHDPVSQSHRQQQSDLLHLCYRWARSYLDRGEAALALQRLYTYRGGDLERTDTDTAAGRLAMKQMLETGFTAAVYANDIEGLVQHAQASSLFAYLSTPSAALDAVLDSVSQRVDAVTASSLPPADQAIATELIHQATTHILNHHLSSNHPYRPATIQTYLSKALTFYPSNAALLAAYYRLTSRLLTLDDRLRNIHHPWLHPSPSSSPTIWLSALRAEMAKSEHSSTRHAARSMFARALLDPTRTRVAAAPAPWHLWLDFELRGLRAAMRAGNEAEARQQWPRVRDVFLAGLRALPCHRGWVLLGLAVFDRARARGVLAQGEVRGVYELLFRRELRVRSEM